MTSRKNYNMIIICLFNKDVSTGHKKRKCFRSRYLYAKQQNFCAFLLKTKEKISLCLS